MSSVDWDDVNVLRNLPDGWYSVPSDSKYGEMIIKDSDIKYNDSVKKAKARHDVVLRKEREIDEFMKGHLICATCGLTKQYFNPYAYNEGDENRVHVTNKRSERDIMTELGFKATLTLRKLIDSLEGAGGDIPLFDILDVFETYILTSEDRGRRRFRISARLEGLCAALLWRYLQIKRKPMTMLEFSRRIKMDRMTISLIVRRLDDYENFKFNKRGRPKRE